MTVRQFFDKNPQYKIINVRRGDENLGADDDTVLQKGDVIECFEVETIQRAL